MTLNCTFSVLFTTISTSRYNEKKETETSTDKIIKQNYVKACGYNWSVSNKRPTKLKDSLKYFEVSDIYFEYTVNLQLHNFIIGLCFLNRLS